MPQLRVSGADDRYQVHERVTDLEKHGLQHSDYLQRSDLVQSDREQLQARFRRICPLDQLEKMHPARLGESI
jgi:hypothetical protein